MRYKLEITEDGSHTLFVPELDEHYHSVHGAIQESVHIFIASALRKCQRSEIKILEVGFGTGLNAFLSALESEKMDKKIFYTSLELYPISATDAKKLNYAELLQPTKANIFEEIHASRWEVMQQITPHFWLLKQQIDFSNPDNLKTNEYFDIVYFDAFAPEKQPEMWSQAIFDKIFSICNPQAILTTYCAKGSVRRMLQQAGFLVERLPGPPGKREILRATTKKD